MAWSLMILLPLQEATVSFSKISANSNNLKKNKKGKDHSKRTHSTSSARLPKVSALSTGSLKVTQEQASLRLCILLRAECNERAKRTQASSTREY